MATTPGTPSAPASSEAVLGGRVAGAPISWGVCEVPGWGHVLPVDTVLGEMAALGLRSTEIGPPGFLPDDPAALREVLGGHGLGLVGGFLAVPMHDETRADEVFAEAARAAAAITAGGGGILVLAAATGLDGYDERPALTDTEWATLLRTAEEIATIAAGHGLGTCLHPHVGTHVEQVGEVERFLADCSLPICLDTGHLMIGGGDPLEITRRYAKRIAHVHLKDVDAAIAGRVRAGEITYMEGVQSDMYTPLGAGDVPVADIVRELEAVGYCGWYVLEQDTALPDGSGDNAARPVRDTRASLEHLASISV